MEKTHGIDIDDDFISRNRLTLTRSAQGIRARLDAKRNEFLNFEPEVLLEFLPFDAVKDLCKDETTAETFGAPKTLEEGVDAFLGYMEFAWGKAEDERGLSAMRSIQKLSAYLWLFGRDDLHDLINDDDLCNPYGAPALIAVCDEMKIPVPDSLRAFAKAPARF